MQPQVVVVGSFVQDLTWKCAAFPHAGETVVGTFVTGPGGKGSNQAVAAGRAGASTLFIGAVGRDAFAVDANDVLHVHAQDKGSGCCQVLKMAPSLYSFITAAARLKQ